MMRDMRRKRQQLSEEESIALLCAGTSGTLATCGEDGQPYAVPLSYVYHDGKLYFHSAQSGHKLDVLRQNSNAAFCVIGQDDVVSEEFTTYFRSVIVFGTIRILEDDAEKRAAISYLAENYAPGLIDARDKEIEKEWNRFCMLELRIDRMTGKEAIELTRQK